MLLTFFSFNFSFFCHVFLDLPSKFFSAPMSAPVAKDDFDWDLLRLSSSDSTVSAVASASSVPRALPGESGGVSSSKRFTLLAIDTVSSACICAGYVGKGGLKRFCTQVVSTSGGTCTVGAHASPKFSLIGDSFYIRATNQAAFCYPSYPHALITDLDERETIRSIAKTQPEWKSYFSKLEAFQADNLKLTPEDLFKPPVVVKLDFDPSLSLKTPAKRVVDGYVERMWETDLTPHIDVPKLPATSATTEQEFWSKASNEWKQPPELIATLKNLHEGFQALGENWPVPFRDIERHFSLVGADLEKIQTAIENLRTDVGKPIPILDIDAPDIWCALDHLATSVADIQHTISTGMDFTSITTTIKELQELQRSLGADIAKLKIHSNEYDERFNTIGPIIKKLLSSTGSAPSHSSKSLEDMERRLARLEAQPTESNV